MDRKIIYPAQIPLVEDQLQASRFTQIGLGRMAGAMFGEGGTGASGLACAPTTGMGVSVGPGQIIQPGAVDSTSYGVLDADADIIPIQYTLSEATSLTVPGVGATYLVYASLSVSDTNNSVLPFYNSANPSQVYAGPDNNGASTATVRASGITLGIGTAVPSGAVPLWQIVVPAGTTAITAGMISTAPGAPFYPNLIQTAPRTTAPFNASLAVALGGYPLGALIADTTTAGKFWVSTAPNNMTTPGAENASWSAAYLTQTTLDGLYVKQYSDDDTDDVSQIGINKDTGDFVAYSNGAWKAFQPAGDYATKESVSQFYPCGGSTTLTVPSWATRFEYILTGGGGGGSGCHSTSSSDTDTNTSGGGGGAGATAIGVIPVSSSGSVSVTIGAGGSPESAGGASTIAYSGTTYATAGGGGSSGFPSIALSAGGSGGTATSNSGTNIPGGNGSDGQNGRLIFAGNGGCSYWGGGGRAGAAGGISASPYGAGGGGAYDGTVASIFYTGGYGASGFLLYRWLP